MIDTNPHFEIRGGGGADTVNAYKTGPSNAGPLDGDSTPIKTVRISWIGSTPFTVGFAFDNFDATGSGGASVPGLGGWGLVGLGLVLLVVAFARTARRAAAPPATRA